MNDVHGGTFPPRHESFLHGIRTTEAASFATVTRGGTVPHAWETTEAASFATVTRGGTSPSCMGNVRMGTSEAQKRVNEAHRRRVASLVRPLGDSWTYGQARA